MTHPSRPNSNVHVLHRQPKLSSLGSQQKSLKALDPWSTKSRQLESQAQRPLSLREGIRSGGLDSHLYEAALDGTTRTTPGRIWKDRNIRDTAAELLDDVSIPIGLGSSESLGVAKHSSAPHVTPHRWACSGLSRSSTALHSLEWETETLFDQNNGSLDGDMALYPCPFRKRNPVRFNIRNHESCARAPFGSILGLKHHIITHHKRTPARRQCPRCQQQFETDWALEAHLLLPRDQICDVNLLFDNDPEDGVTDETLRMLVGRGSAEEAWTWEGIWDLVFPGDLEVPDSDFQPVAELVEVEQAFDEGQELLKESLREKLQLLVPAALDDDYLSFLTGQVELVFETHRVNIMKQSQNRSSATTNRRQSSYTRTAEQQCPARKPNRRSRRSTLLQTLQRNPPDQTTGFASHRNSRISSGTRQEHTSDLFRLRSAAQHPTNHTSLPPDPQATSHRLSTITSATYTAEPNPNPRDSRDSGIGIPCDTCDSEPCTCSEAASSPNADDCITHPKQDQRCRQNQQPPLDSGDQPRHQRHHAQPRLSINTQDLSAHGVAGGRFSPESFKQRVLRQQLMPPRGSGLGMQGLNEGV